MSASPFLSIANRAVPSETLRMVSRFTLGTCRQCPGFASSTTSTPGVWSGARAFVPIEAELHILGGDGVAVAKLEPFAQSYARPSGLSSHESQPRLPCSRIAAGRHRAPIHAQLMLETTVSYTGLSTLDGKPPRTAPDDWSLKIAPISGLSSRLFGTESHIRSKCRRRSGSG
jgi:hypothetical protein